MLKIHRPISPDAFDFTGFSLAHNTVLLLLFRLLHRFDHSFDYRLRSFIQHFLQLLSGVFEVVSLSAELWLAGTLGVDEEFSFLVDVVGV